MKTPDTKKKTWAKPQVHTLSIKKDTFSGSGTGPEGEDRVGPPFIKR